MYYSVYNSTTGFIKRSGSVASDMVQQQNGSGESVVLGILDSATKYIVLGVVTSRPVNFILADKTSCLAYDQEVVTLTGVPNGATIYTGLGEVVADGTDILLTFYEPRLYHIRVTNFPDTDFEVTMNAN